MTNKINELNRLVSRIIRYEKKYSSVYFILTKTASYCLRETSNLLVKNLLNKFNKVNTNKLSIAIRLDGGIGDNLVLTLWVKEFSKHLDENCFIDLFPNINRNNLGVVAQEHTFVNKVYVLEQFNSLKNKYNVVICFRRFPYFEKFNLRTDCLSSDTLYFLNLLHEKYTSFYKDNSKFFILGSSVDTLIDLWSICRGEKRIQQPDIDNLFNISEKTPLYLSLQDLSYKAYLDYGLNKKKYITITRSVDQNYDINNNVRCWPLKYYEELIRLLKKVFPELYFVQLGPSTSIPIDGVDLNLLGKTSLEEVKGILKQSLLHIDGECGMVHIKHFLNGVSVVLFAQTSIEYLGYSNNINLKSDGCPHWCEWISDNWQNHCIRGFKNPPCMEELKPEYIFDNIYPVLNRILSSKEKKISIQDISVSEFNIKDIQDKGKFVLWGLELYKSLETSLDNIEHSDSIRGI